MNHLSSDRETAVLEEAQKQFREIVREGVGDIGVEDVMVANAAKGTLMCLCHMTSC